MHRPWQIWLSFAACLLLLVAAVGWLSAKALQSDAAEATARRQAVIEENARLALWRMDTLLAPLIAQEGAVPIVDYSTFPKLGPELPAGPAGITEKKPSPALLPSLLLASRNPLVRLHFQWTTSGAQEKAGDSALTSPEVPTGSTRDRAVPRFISESKYAQNAIALAELASSLKGPELLAHLPPNNPTGGFDLQIELTGPDVVSGIPNAVFEVLPTTGDVAAMGQDSMAQSTQSLNSPAQQQIRNRSEYEARQRFVGSNSMQSQLPQIGNNQTSGYFGAETRPAAFPLTATTMKPLWIEGQLLLARRAGLDYVQGALLDWPGLKQRLLKEVADLLPNADLVPAKAISAATTDSESRLLASLPVRLVTGELSLAGAETWSPVRLSLVFAWSALLLAALAVGLVLRGVLSLSERRAAFVSAVTHELRTPLTTFRMYAEMLSEDMVPDETARRSYLQTLRVEAERLTHLVANVLAYARLERGALTGRIERVTVERLLNVATHRLTERAAQAGFTLVVEADEATREIVAFADPSAVEQILFNLVDNACKYAAEAQYKRLRLVVSVSNEKAKGDRRVELRLCDRGPGVAPVAQRRLFQAFRKSAQDAAHSAPGVGLGLALSRRLARELGGDLRYEPSPTGACFVLSLRAAK